MTVTKISMRPREPRVVESELIERIGRPEFCDKRVSVIVPDRTRPLSYDLTIVPLLSALHLAGAEIKVIVGLGLHRAMSKTERRDLQRICDTYDAHLLEHDARSGALVQHTSGAWLHRRNILNAEILIAVGIVEPHQYAGFSGGVKGIVVGCGGAETIADLHDVRDLKHPKMTVGNIIDNPFQKKLWEYAKDLPMTYGMFEVPQDEHLYFGEVAETFEAAVEGAGRSQFENFENPFDWIHLPVPKTKAQNFYQASRAATYIALAKNTAIKPGGTLIVNAACPEGIGRGTGELACAEALKRGASALRSELDDKNIASIGGAQRAYVLALAMKHAKIVLVGAKQIPTLEAFGIQQFDNLDHARDALALNGNGYTATDPFHRIPVVSV